MQNFLVRLFSSFFYAGFFPLAPGSLASAVGMLIGFGLSSNPFLYVLIWIIITGLGFFVSDRSEKITGMKDPSFIVIDEVSGIMLAFFMLPLNAPVIWSTFFLFRAFDMFKIYPANKFEKLKGGVGVMMDDIIAGIYTNLVMHAALWQAGLL